MRFFYVLYIRESPLSDFVEAIRFLADPSEKSAAHITVRGPYLRRTPLRNVQNRLAGEQIKISSVGNFFSHGQKTVFWNCYSPRLKSVWKKNDFGFNPHVTIYDGLSSSFAHALYRTMEQYRYDFEFRAGSLELYSSLKRQTSFRLQLSFNEGLICRVLHERITVSQVSRLSVKERLQYIDKICRYLSEDFSVGIPTQLSLV